MEWMARTEDRRKDPKIVLPGAKSIVIVAVNYHTDAPSVDSADKACISRYAWGNEYAGPPPEGGLWVYSWDEEEAEVRCDQVPTVAVETPKDLLGVPKARSEEHTLNSSPW